MKEYKNERGSIRIRLHQIVNVKVRNTIHQGKIIKYDGWHYYIQCENGRIYLADRYQLEEINEVELIAEQHRLFDLAKEQEEALKIICGKEVGFTQLYYSNNVEDYNNTLYFRFKPSACESMALTQAEFDLVKKVVKKYGNKED